MRNINIMLTNKEGPSMGELDMTAFVLKIYVVHKSECWSWTKNWPALTKKTRNPTWSLLICIFLVGLSPIANLFFLTIGEFFHLLSKKKISLLGFSTCKENFFVLLQRNNWSTVLKLQYDKEKSNFFE